jgi:glycosyltransferase involved in cell wall biosynthesis
VKITQILCAAGPVDAVTNQALACRALFEEWGWGGDDYAAVVAPGVSRRAIRPLQGLSPSADELLLLHYSGYARGLEELFNSGRRSMVISHNITPSRYFWYSHPMEAVRCEMARDQLAELGRGAGALAGVSAYNVAELQAMTGRSAAVIPVLFDRSRLPSLGDPPDLPPTILFVGRLAPHKRQDLVICAFAVFRRRHQPDARLVLVGTPQSPAYAEALVELAEKLAPGAVTFESAVTPARLWDYYRSAHVFLCLSEHEGFCIPLLEAFHFGVPVVARDAAAIGEVVGDAGVLLGDDDGIATVAELLRIVVDDAELRAELRARGERRLAAFDHARTAEKLREHIDSLAAA